jgi:hypothetical protein
MMCLLTAPPADQPTQLPAVNLNLSSPSRVTVSRTIRSLCLPSDGVHVHYLDVVYRITWLVHLMCVCFLLSLHTCECCCCFRWRCFFFGL